jgi:hypothetical protein
MGMAASEATDPFASLSTSPAPCCSARPAYSSSSNCCRSSKMLSKLASSCIIAGKDLAERLRTYPSSSIPFIFLLIFLIIFCLFYVLINVFRDFIESIIQNGRQDQKPSDPSRLGREPVRCQNPRVACCTWFARFLIHSRASLCMTIACEWGCAPETKKQFGSQEDSFCSPCKPTRCKLYSLKCAQQACLQTSTKPWKLVRQSPLMFCAGYRLQATSRQISGYQLSL